MHADAVHVARRAHALLGQPFEERNCLAEATGLWRPPKSGVHEAEFLYLMPGDLLNAAGDRSAAERNYRQAMAVAERQSAQLLQLKASIGLARLWRDQGKRVEARHLLARIFNWFTEGFNGSDLKDARALLDDLA